MPEGIYYCNAAVQYDALNDWPLREVDGTTFLQVEAGGQYELQYEFAGESSATPSVLSGINRIQRWSQSKPLYPVFTIFFVSIYSAWTQEQWYHQEQTSVWTRGRLLSSSRLRQFRHEEIGAVRHKHPFRHEAIFPENTKSSPPGHLSFRLISQLVGKQPGGLLHFLFSFLCDCGA